MKTRIIIDAMGGDNAPGAVIRGAVRGAIEKDVSLILTGRHDDIARELKDVDTSGADIRIADAASVITMDDPPSAAMKEKSDSSVSEACKLLAAGEGDAVISSGNTGALYTAASMIVRRHKGIRRAALGAVVPLANPFIIVDSGANIDATPEILLQFARMGSLYCSELMGVEAPRVALINNGAEPSKGTQLYRDTYPLLEKSGLNFVGNCEGRDLPNNFCDVLVCDGFTGNIVLKLVEGMGKFMGSGIKNVLLKNFATKAGALLIKKEMTAFTSKLDHRVYGGAPLLGIAKPVIKSHGAAEETSICAAVRQAADYVRSGLNDKIAGALASPAGSEET